MKNKIMGSLGFGLYVGLVYAIGSYLGYRLGKSSGRFEADLEHLEREIERDMRELEEKYPELFEKESV